MAGELGAKTTEVHSSAASRAANVVEAEAPDQERSRLGLTFRSLRHRDYRLLWFGTIFSGSGMWIQQATVGWLTYELTGSPFLLGAVNGMRSLPLLLLGPFAGVAADRLDRKKLLLSIQVGIVILTAGFAVVIGLGYLAVWQLFFVTFLSGIGWAFNMPVRQSVIPNLVPRKDLMNAVALSSGGFNSARIVGPSIAGLLIASVGPAQNFFLQALAYGGVALMVMQMNIPPPLEKPRSSVKASLSEGAVFIWRHPTLRTQMILALAPVVIGLPYIALLPIFASEVLDVGPGGFGLLMAAPGLGAVVGTLAVASLDHVQRKGILLLAAIFGLGATLVLFSLSNSFPVSLLLLVIAGALQMVYLTTNMTIVQLTVPDELRGRVMGVYMLNQGLLPLGSVLAGVLASIWSAPTAVCAMGAVVMLLALVFGSQPSRLRSM